jgi:hypothetical protein
VSRVTAFVTEKIDIPGWINYISVLSAMEPGPAKSPSEAIIEGLAPFLNIRLSPVPPPLVTVLLKADSQSFSKKEPHETSHPVRQRSHRPGRF